MKRWRVNDKRNSKGFVLITLEDKLNVEFIKVKAHSGNQYNDEADQLAKDAI